MRLDNVTVTDNYSSSHSGAFLVWGSTFVVTDSRIERVRTWLGWDVMEVGAWLGYAGVRLGHPFAGPAVDGTLQARQQAPAPGITPPPPTLTHARTQTHNPGQNVAALFGGAVLGQLALFNATRTSISYNEAVYGGGGGVKLMSGVGLFKECRLVGNKAAYGGALEVRALVWAGSCPAHSSGCASAA